MDNVRVVLIADMPIAAYTDPDIANQIVGSLRQAGYSNSWAISVLVDDVNPDMAISLAAASTSTKVRKRKRA